MKKVLFILVLFVSFAVTTNAQRNNYYDYSDGYNLGYSTGYTDGTATSKQLFRGIVTKIISDPENFKIYILSNEKGKNFAFTKKQIDDSTGSVKRGAIEIGDEFVIYTWGQENLSISYVYVLSYPKEQYKKNK